MRHLFLFYAFLIISFGYTFPSQKQPTIRSSIVSISDSAVNITYKLYVSDTITKFVNTQSVVNCDYWWMELTILIEQFDKGTGKYTLLPCGVDVDPVMLPDGTFYKTENIANLTLEKKVVIQKWRLQKGKYRYYIKYNYQLKNNQKFVTSNYNNFEIE